ncbi:MAG: antitoxin [Nanoarchaeota archaeon]|nr:antitoxin [Nanoarchaeota archaeon]
MIINHIMKTIVIRDDVYRKLNEIKGNKSFSDIIEELIEESLSLRKKKLEKYFSILNEEEAKELEREIKEIRKRSDEIINRKLSDY